MTVITHIAARLRRRPESAETLIEGDVEELRRLIGAVHEPSELYLVISELYQLAVWFDRHNGAKKLACAVLEVVLPATLRLSRMVKACPVV